MTEGTDKLLQENAEILDVWSRTAPRYRRRAVFMLCLLALLFGGLCCFTHWLRTGVAAPWQNEDYWTLMARSFRPVGNDQFTLIDFLTAPISVQRSRVHGVIIGLLFASLGSIPLLIAILYRFRVSIVFAAMVVFLATMPWLGITILIGCALTSMRPFRFSFRYASALLGLVPIGIYFVSASIEPAGSKAHMIQHRALLYAPWVLAMLGSCVICALALAIAKLIGYRPGGIPPILALLFAIPVFLFATHVGWDELEYRVLEQAIGPGNQTVFVPVDVKKEAGHVATRIWSESGGESYDAILRRTLGKKVESVHLQCENDRASAVSRCDRFLERFPTSRYVPNVLFLKGRAQDQRLLTSGLLEDNRATYRNDVPSRASFRTWETLIEQYPDSDFHATALYKLSVLRARDGDIDAAVRGLDDLLHRFDIGRATTQGTGRPAPTRDSVFRGEAPSARLGLSPEVWVLQARRIKEMLLACRTDPRRPMGEILHTSARSSETPVSPVQLLLWLDDADPHYRRNLEGIARSFPESQAAGYAEVRLVLQERAISRRLKRFAEAAEKLAGRPCGAEALFWLGEARLEDSILDEAKTAFDKLIKDYAESCWAVEAKERLSSLSMLEVTAESSSD
ncbi:MAG: tetratricopeptide repeat protein [Planctomycetota bacterium]